MYLSIARGDDQMPERVEMHVGKKFMWDGRRYESEEKAKEIEENYKKDGFETLLIKEGDDSFVYTRRVVTEIVLEGEAVV